MKNTDQWWLAGNNVRIEYQKKKYDLADLHRRIQQGIDADAPQHVIGLAQARMDYQRALQQKKKRLKTFHKVKSLDPEDVFNRVVQALLTIPEQNPYIGLDAVAQYLQVKPHAVKHALMRANREGWSTKAQNSGVHDTHRDYMGWGGPWVSSWRPTIFQINTEKLRATHGQTQVYETTSLQM